jgi:hypothetical protein
MNNLLTVHRTEEQRTANSTFAKKLQKLWQKDAKQGKRKKRKNDVRD